MKHYELTKQKNIRDIGGMITQDGRRIKYGHIYRGPTLKVRSDEDIKIIKSFNLTDVIDFRNHDECLTSPDYYLEGVNYHILPSFEDKQDRKLKGEDGNLLWFIDEGVSGHDHLLYTYDILITSKQSQNAYRELFNILLQDDKRVYFHCSQGKDRTGVAAYLIEIGLGVSEKEAREDYLYSNLMMQGRVEHLIEKVKDKPFYNETYQQSLKDVFAVKEEYLDNAIRMMNEHYGGTLNYLKDILKVDLERLKALYLE